jgi:hypothetical protein
LAVPVVETVETPVQPRQYMMITGVNFGYVESVEFIDPLDDVNNIIATEHQIDSGTSIHVSVPDGIFTGTSGGENYIIRLTTIENEVSINEAGYVLVQPISGLPVLPSPTPVEDPYPLPPEGSEFVLDQLRAMLRRELADQGRSFQTIVVGNGAVGVTRYEMPVRHIDPSNVIVTLTPFADVENPVILQPGVDFTMDAFGGAITLTNALALKDVLTITGTRYRFFEPPVLDQFLRTAFIQATYEQTHTTTTINAQGYRMYQEFAYDWTTLQEVYWLPVTVLAKTFALWVLITDASYNIDVSEDGANIPRSQLYTHLAERLAAETARWKNMAQMLNIGIERIEMTTLRRISRTTNRLVPIYVDKEYDDWNLPIRVLPGIDHGTDGGDEFIDPYYDIGSGYGGGFGP